MKALNLQQIETTMTGLQRIKRNKVKSSHKDALTREQAKRERQDQRRKERYNKRCDVFAELV